MREEKSVRHAVRCVALLSLRLARRAGIHQLKSSSAGWGEHILSTHAVCLFFFLLLFIVSCVVVSTGVETPCSSTVVKYFLLCTL